jgi:hypothetical protein
MMGSAVVTVGVGLGVFGGIGAGVGVYVIVMALSTIRVTLTSRVISTTVVTSTWDIWVTILVIGIISGSVAQETKTRTRRRNIRGAILISISYEDDGQLLRFI